MARITNAAITGAPVGQSLNNALGTAANSNGGKVISKIVGSNRDDVIDVSIAVEPYWIDGLAGNDVIRGSAGDDTIVGGKGNDFLFGAAGNDVFLVQGADQGTDTIFGGNGYDVIRGSSGNDVFRLASLTGANSIEEIDGVSGVDVIRGSGSNDVLDFSAVKLVNIAWIDGDFGNDTITGTAGNDLIAGGSGADILFGGGGTDTAYYFSASSEYVVTVGAGNVLVTRTALGETDTLYGFSYLQFSDKTVQIAANPAPSAVPDTVTTKEDAPVTIDVLANDVGPVGDSMAVTSYTQAARGLVTLNADGTLSYAPNLNYVGQDSFSYTVTNSAGSATTDVTVNVTSVNDAPVATNDQANATENGATTLAVATLLANDTDPDIGDSKTIQSVAAISSAGAQVSLVGGNVIYTPGTLFDTLRVGQTGTDSFTYTMRDGAGATATATVSLTVVGANDAPTAVNDQVAVAEDGAATLAGAVLLANDTDPDSGDTKSIQSVSALSNAGAQVSLVGGNVIYNPGALFNTLKTGQTANDSFTYTMRDAAGVVSSARVSVTVTGANDAPVANDDIASNTNKNTALTIAASALIANDTDVDGDALSVASVGNASGGAVAVNGANIVFTPTTGYVGAAGFDYTASDGHGGNDVGRVSFAVQPVNSPPIANDDIVNANAGQSITFNALLNDSDPDNDAISIAAFTQAAHGTVTLNADGTFTYTPQAGYSGSDGFIYTLSDGQASDTGGVAITIAPAPPVASSFRQMLTSTPEDGWVALNLNHFQDVWTPSALRPAATNGPNSVILAWSSMAWDPHRGELIFWGGGHANYSGNEIYLWDSKNLMWERGSLPSQVVNIGGSRFETVDGVNNSPIASHTYDNSEFLPIVDRFVTFGGAAWNSGDSFMRTNGTLTGPYFWDPSKADPNKVGGLTGSAVGGSTSILGGQMWQNRDNIDPPGPGRHVGDTTYGMLDSTTGYAQENGKDVLYIGGVDLWKYTVNDVNDPSKDTYQLVGTYWDGMAGQGAGALDPVHHVYVRTASVFGDQNTFTYWDTSTPGPDNHNHNFTPTVIGGTFDMTKLWKYGMDFDPVRGEFVLWGGESDVWILKAPTMLSTSGWTLTHATATGLSGVPHVDTQFTGVLGKWKYIADQDIFLGVTDPVNGTIWAYKPDNWQPKNVLPAATAKDTSAVALNPGDTLSANALVSWADGDGDAVGLRFIDKSIDPTSGHFRLNGVDQAANTAIDVTEAQVKAGALLWVAGQAGTSDQVAVTPNDPFGSGGMLNLLVTTVLDPLGITKILNQPVP